jgi:hypothetical protein
MAKKLSPNNVERFVVNGLVEGNRRYYKLSGGEYLTDRGVESFLAYFVAQPFQKFFSAKDTCILLEVSRGEFAKNYIREMKLSGPPASGSRFDIVLLRKSGKDGLERDAFGVIELKREDPEEYPRGYRKDIKRLASIVGDCRTNKDFQFGCFAGVVCEKREDNGLIEKQRSRWTAFMTRAAKQMGIKVRIFSPLNRQYEFDKSKRNGKVRSGYWRIEVIGCVFYPPAK